MSFFLQHQIWSHLVLRNMAYELLLSEYLLIPGGSDSMRNVLLQDGQFWDKKTYKKSIQEWVS